VVLRGASWWSAGSAGSPGVHHADSATTSESCSSKSSRNRPRRREASASLDPKVEGSNPSRPTLSNSLWEPSSSPIRSLLGRRSSRVPRVPGGKRRARVSKAESRDSRVVFPSPGVGQAFVRLPSRAYARACARKGVGMPQSTNDARSDPRFNHEQPPSGRRSSLESGTAPHLAHPVMRHQPAHMSRDNDGDNSRCAPPPKRRPANHGRPRRAALATPTPYGLTMERTFDPSARFARLGQRVCANRVFLARLPPGEVRVVRFVALE
jgi:hypothetical protein